MTAVSQTELAPLAYSPIMPLRLFASSHAVASAISSAPIVEVTHVAEVPDPSESRYWCIP